MTEPSETAALIDAAGVIAEAEALLITAGAGMGVDSGLPDFRGNEGFWNAYPPYRKLGKGFVEMANPEGFSRDPAFAWGFYGHRLNLYRESEPHEGFETLRKWADEMPRGSFVMTSNVDGHFQRSEFSEDQIYEVHGSIHYLQCTRPCSRQEIWSAEDLHIEVDPETMRAAGSLPRCPCGEIARPNILMFGDWSYLEKRNEVQRRRLQDWLAESADARIAIIELGAGTAVPTVRLFSEDVSLTNPTARLIRINPREPELPGGQGISLSMGALSAISQIQCHLENR